MPAVFDPSQPFSAIDEAIAGSIPANPSVIDLAVAPPIPAAGVAAPEAPVFNPEAPFTTIPEAAASVVGGPVFDASKEFQKSFLPEDLNTKTVEELDADKDFNPVAFGFEHEAALNSDPVLKQRVLDIYKRREATFRTTADQLKGAASDPLKAIAKPFKATFEVGKMLLGGAAQVAKNVSDAGIGGAARLLGAASVGGKAGEAGLNEEGKRIARAQAEVIAAPEAAATGTVDLLRRGVRTAVETAAKLDPTGFVQDVTGEKPFSELTNEEVAARFSNDVAGKKAIAEASRGAGEMMKAIGLHADELKEAGIELRPGVIEAMSPVLDITNLVPLGAGTKVGLMTKTGGRYAVRELATAATPLQASAFTKAMNSVAEGLGKSAKGVGVAAEDAGVAVRNELKKLGDFGNVTGVGALAGGFRGTGAAILLGTKVVPKAVELAGRGLQAVSKSVPGAIRTGAEIGEEFVKGYGQGLLFTAPFMIGADAEEREGLLGAAGLGGVARGGIRGLKIAGEVAQDRLAGTIFKAVDQSKPPETPAYGTDPRLDAESAAQVAKLSADPVRARAARVAQFEKTFDAETARLDADGPLTPRQLTSRLKLRAERIAKIPEVVKAQQNLLGWARHLFKDSGVEFYATDDAGMMRQTGGQSGRGYTVKTGQTIAPDGTVKPLIRVFLNGDVEALPHEMLHALGDLNAPGYAEFRNEVNATLTPDQKKSFETIYNTVHNGGLPEAQWKYRLTPEQVSNEIAAELFSRTVLGEDLSGVSSPLRKGAALFTADLLENHLGIPLGKLTSTQAKDFVPKGTKIKAGFSTLGLRPGVKAQALGHNFVQSLLKQAKEGGLTAPPEKSALAGGTLVPGEISRRPPPPPPGPSGPGAAPISPRGTPPAPAPATPGATTPAVPPATTPSGPRNIRVTRERQEAFGIPKAKEVAAALGNPDVVARVNEISEVMGTDTPALELEYRSVKDDGSPGDPTSRNPRRSAQEEERAAKAMGEIPENARELVQKIIVPVRWVTVGKGTLKSPFKPELIAMSLDKVAANVQMVVKDATGKRGAEVPYERAGDTLSDQGWSDVIADLKTYARNQSNGYKGDGGKLIRPEKSAGMDIPNETPGFTPTEITDKNKADFLNMVQGFKLPFTNIRRTPGIPANLKGQKLAEINFRKVEPPVKAAIRPQDLLKQTFPAEVTEPLFPGRGPMDIGEPNPMRNQFWDAGVDVGKLIEGVERISPEQVAKVTRRPKIDYVAPVTDTIRGGFLPGDEGGATLFIKRATTDEIGREVLDSSQEGWQKLTSDLGGLTGAAYKLGNRLKDRADVAKLRGFEAEAKDQYAAAKTMQDFDGMMLAATKKQFFTEALETATGMNPNKQATIARVLGADWKPPFPEIQEGQLLPAADFAKELDPIKEAAVKAENGQIFTGTWHGEAVYKLLQEANDFNTPGLHDENLIDGFTTVSGRFLTRTEAFNHAEAIKQLNPDFVAASKANKDTMLESFDFEKVKQFLPGEPVPEKLNGIATVEGPDASGALPGNELGEPDVPVGSIGKAMSSGTPRPDNTALGLPVEGVDASVQYAGENDGLTPARFLAGKAPGEQHTPASPSYPDADRLARERGGNAWVRQSADASNKERVLLVQFTPELMYPNGPDPISTPYYDKLYSGARPGYARGTDFWELPQWVAVATENLGSKADFYAVRNMDEAKAFLAEADYGRVAFSVMDVSKAVTEELVPHIKGLVDLGGYTDRTGAVAKNPRAKIWDSMNAFIESMGTPYKKGFDYRHFRGTEIIPRLELSAGCRHKCTFCTIDRTVTNSPLGEIDAQVDSFSGLNAKLVYLNDKTFGQSPNIAEMPRLYKEMKAANPEFDGFVIQTTAAQMRGFTDQFLKDSGIKYVELGVETYNDAILKTLRKPATEKLIDESVEKLRRNKINFIPNIIIGFPGETAATYARTMEFLNKNSDIVSHLNTYNLAVYEGTEMSKTVKTKTASDADENSFSKSFYADPKIHEDFAKGLYEYGTKQLDQKAAFLPGDNERPSWVPESEFKKLSAYNRAIVSKKGVTSQFWISSTGGIVLAPDGHVNAGRKILGKSAPSPKDPYFEVKTYEAMDKLGYVRGQAYGNDAPVIIKLDGEGSGKRTAAIKKTMEDLAFDKGHIVQFNERDYIDGRSPGDIEKENGNMGFLLPKVDEPRAVKSAAIRDSETGEIFAASTHGEAMRKASDAAGIPRREFSLSTAYGNPNYEQGFVTQGGDFLTRAEARNRVEELGQISPENLPSATQYKNDKNLESVGFEHYRNFLPGDFMPKKGKSKSFPLTPYEEFIKERDEKAPKPKPRPITIRAISKPTKRAEAKSTGWILPNKSFIPLDVAFHENYLAENADELNEKFGTAFGKVPDPEDRLAALNAGFVRIRGGLQAERRTSGPSGVVIELNGRYFNRFRPALESYLLDRVDSIDSLAITLLNDKGGTIDNAYARVHELDGAEKANQLLATLDDLRLRGSEGQALPGGDETLPGLNLPSEERAKQLRLRGLRGIVKITTPQAAQDFPLEPGDIVIKKKR